MYSCAQNFKNLVEATKINDLETVRDLMWGCDPKERNSLPFLTAAEYGSLECLEALKSVSDMTANDAEALMRATKSGHMQCVHFLWNKSIPTFNSRGHKALVVAATKGHKNIVDYILERGIDPTFKYSMPLQVAALNGRQEIVDLLYPLSNPHEALNVLRSKNETQRSCWQWFEDLCMAHDQKMVIEHEIQTTQLVSVRKI